VHLRQPVQQVRDAVTELVRYHQVHVSTHDVRL
jgi:hypothetical protein